jgi:hypothetical protein
MKNLKHLILVITALCLQSCTIISLPAAKPEVGKAVIKGATVYKYLVTAQYSYVLGVDGKLFKSGIGSKQVSAGKRRLALGASHAAGLQSFVEVIVNLEAGKKYIVAADSVANGCQYKVLELPEKKEVNSALGQYVSGFGIQSPTGSVQGYWEAKGWVVE